jgi:NAD(P)-dependent dehydrogenase (short-subunit alcohol dehydrogenase family)
MTELRFDGRVAVITGAGTGLGRAHARLLASRGAKIVVNDLGCRVDGQGADAAPAEAVVNEIKAAGGEAVASTDSVSDAAGGARIIDQALDSYGRVDILVHNAGILRDKAFHNMDETMFDTVIAVHLKGAFNVAQPAYRWMRDAKYGRMVMTSSVAGLYGNFGQVNYGAAKAGLIGMAKSMAIEGARYGITSNVIVPAATTRMTKNLGGAQGMLMPPEMVSYAVAFLAHEQCTLSGDILIAVGGLISRGFVGESAGVFQREWSVADVAARLDEICNLEGFIAPASTMEHVAHFLAAAKSARPSDDP